MPTDGYAHRSTPRRFAAFRAIPPSNNQPVLSRREVHNFARKRARVIKCQQPANCTLSLSLFLSLSSCVWQLILYFRRKMVTGKLTRTTLKKTRRNRRPTILMIAKPIAGVLARGALARKNPGNEPREGHGGDASWNPGYARRKHASRTRGEPPRPGIPDSIGMCRECPLGDVLTPCHSAFGVPPRAKVPLRDIPPVHGGVSRLTIQEDGSSDHSSLRHRASHSEHSVSGSTSGW